MFLKGDLKNITNDLDIFKNNSDKLIKGLNV